MRQGRESECVKLAGFFFVLFFLNQNSHLNRGSVYVPHKQAVGRSQTGRFPLQTLNKYPKHQLTCDKVYKLMFLSPVKKVEQKRKESPVKKCLCGEGRCDTCVAGISCMVCAGRAATASSRTTPPAANPPPSASSTREEPAPTGTAAGGTPRLAGRTYLVASPECVCVCRYDHVKLSSRGAAAFDVAGVSRARDGPSVRGKKSFVHQDRGDV